jgi:hypothetical protein
MPRILCNHQLNASPVICCQFGVLYSNYPQENDYLGLAIIRLWKVLAHDLRIRNQYLPMNQCYYAFLTSPRAYVESYNGDVISASFVHNLNCPVSPSFF